LRTLVIDIKVGKVVVLDAKARTVTLEAGEVLSYEKLVLATGTEVFAATSIYWPVKSKMPTATEKDRKRLKKKESWELWFLFRNTQP
jgi:NAD(P)H-nitrite reductase large subunit